MANDERSAKLEELLLVQARLVASFERKVDQWIESAKTRGARLDALSTAVLERMDRFIQEREH